MATDRDSVKVAVGDYYPVVDDDTEEYVIYQCGEDGPSTEMDGEVCRITAMQGEDVDWQIALAICADHNRLATQQGEQSRAMDLAKANQQKRVQLMGFSADEQAEHDAAVNRVSAALKSQSGEQLTLGRSDVEGVLQRMRIVDCDNLGVRHSLMARYPDMIHKARAAAKSCGYALAVHGSEIRDMDLIAVPWVEDPKPVDDLVAAITAAVGGHYKPAADDVKPHGRLGRTILVAGSYIDLSIAPTNVHHNRLSALEPVLVECKTAMEMILSVGELAAPHVYPGEKLHADLAAAKTIASAALAKLKGVLG